MRQRRATPPSRLARGAVLAAALAIGLASITDGTLPAASAANVGAPACDRQDTGVPAGRLAMLARGFNLTGWLDGPAVRRPDEQVLADLRTRGFTHIRLPVTAERLMPAFTARDAIDTRLAELDRALAVLTRLGFAVSLDLHPGEAFNRLHVAETARALVLIDTLWSTLARRYARYPDDRLFFELLNEPAVDATIWNAQAARLIARLRAEAPGRTLIFGPANFQRIDALLDVPPFADPNIVYAVHFYDPMIFTHQGLDWSDDPLRHLQGVPFPTSLDDGRIRSLLGVLAQPAAATLVKDALASPWTEARIARSIAEAGAWGMQHRRPVILNEFGVLGWKAPIPDRLRWLATVRAAAERHCIGWTHWDYADGFGFVQRVGSHEIPDSTVLDALLGP